MKFAENIRDRETYIEKIQVKSKSFVRSSTIAITSFEVFLQKKHQISLDGMIKEILQLDEEKRIDAICDVCQSWVNHLHQNKKNSKTIRVYFSLLKLYLHYKKIRLTTEDIKQSIDFPIRIKEEKHPLEVNSITDILTASSYAKKGLYLALLSSGMRIGEAIQIRKMDVFTGVERTMIKIPARITKTKQGRTTYISIEASKFIISKLKTMNDDDLLWGTNKNPRIALNAEEKAFRDYLRKIGFNEKYDSGTLKISLHSFRSFFFTKAARCHDENYAHKMTGHGGYLMQYDRLTDEEKLEMYIELEPDLLIYDQTKNTEKIRRLKEANEKLENSKSEMNDMKQQIKELQEKNQQEIEEKNLLAANYRDEKSIPLSDDDLKELSITIPELKKLINDEIIKTKQKVFENSN